AAGEAAAVEEHGDAGAAQPPVAVVSVAVVSVAVIVRALLLIVRSHHARVTLEGALEDLVRGDRILERLAGSGDVAGAEQVLLAQRDGIEPELAGDAIHV